MADYRIVKGLGRDINSAQAGLQILKTGSALKRVGQSALRVLRGEEEMPTTAEGVKTLLQDNLWGKRPDKYAHLSRFGTPVRNYLKIQDGAYDVLDSFGQRVKRRYQGLFLDTAIISVNMPKNIILTEIAGKNGTRKEYVGNSDYEIQITGELTTDHPDIYPAAEVAMLRDIINSPEPLTVICPHLMTFGINTIVIKGADFPQEAGVYNVQRFSIAAISHAPIDIYIEEAKKEVETNKSRISQIIEDADEKYNELHTRINEELEGFFDRGQI